MSASSFRAKVISAGRVTIPYEVMETEGIKAGDFVDVTVKLARKVLEATAK